MTREWARVSDQFEQWCDVLDGELKEERVSPEEVPNDLFDEEMHHLTCIVGDTAVRLYEYGGTVDGIDVDQNPGDDHLVVDIGNIDVEDVDISLRGGALRASGERGEPYGPMSEEAEEHQTVFIEPE